jgi:hypothetical protein
LVFFFFILIIEVFRVTILIFCTYFSI